MKRYRTPGEWKFKPADRGHSGSYEEPPDPGYPPHVYVEVEEDGDPESGPEIYAQTVILATLQDPLIDRVPHPEDENDPGIALFGDASENGRLIAAAPRMLAVLEDAGPFLTGLSSSDPEGVASLRHFTIGET